MNREGISSRHCNTGMQPFPGKCLHRPHRLAFKLGLLLTVILALGKLRQGHREFKVSLGYIASLSQNIKTKGWLSKISCLLLTGFMWADNFKKKTHPDPPLWPATVTWKHSGFKTHTKLVFLSRVLSSILSFLTHQSLH